MKFIESFTSTVGVFLLLATCLVLGVIAHLIEQNGKLPSTPNEPPRVVIRGPETGQPGELLVYEATECEAAKHISWSVTPVVSGRNQLVVAEDGRQCILASLPGQYVLQVLVSNASGHARATQAVSVPSCPGPAPTPGPAPAPRPGPVPEPLPQPTPKPEPDPAVNLPAGEFGELPRAIYTAAMAVESKSRGAEANELGRAAGAIAAEIAAGALKSPQKIADKIATEIKSKGPPWKPFMQSTQAKLMSLYDAGQLETPDRWAVMLRECQIALNAVK
jgi:hypothetical protein